MFVLARSLGFKISLEGTLFRTKMPHIKRGLTEISAFDELLQAEVKQAK